MFEAASKLARINATALGMRRVALYLRVSTDDQTTDNQRPEVEQLARQRGAVVQVYEENASAAKSRPAFARCLADARKGHFDVLVIWSLDRFGRSMVGNLLDVLELDRLGVQLVSVRETWVDTTGPTRALLVVMFSWVAEQERLRLIERTRAGMARAARSGTKSGRRVGRPRRRFDVDAARASIEAGASQRTTAAACGVSLAVLQRALARTEERRP